MKKDQMLLEGHWLSLRHYQRFVLSLASSEVVAVECEVQHPRAKWWLTFSFSSGLGQVRSPLPFRRRSKRESLRGTRALGAQDARVLREDLKALMRCRGTCSLHLAFQPLETFVPIAENRGVGKQPFVLYRYERRRTLRRRESRGPN